MKINSKEERKKFLEENVQGMGSYALVTFNNHTESIWITKYADWDEDGNWFLEAPNDLHRYEFKDDSESNIRNYVKEQYEEEHIDEGIKYTKSMIRDGWLYEINSPQTGPFLPDVLDDLTLISEVECLEWILNEEHDSTPWNPFDENDKD